MAKFVDCAFSLWNAQRMGFLLVAWSFLFAQLLGGATSFPRNLDNITHDGQITIFKADETYSTNEPKQAHRVYKAPSLAPPQSKTAVWDKIRQSNDYIQSDPPANVTGMYRGSWTKISFDSALEQTRVLRKDGGVAIFELRSHPSEESGLHTLEGDLVIRDGAYVTDDDIRMRVHGIYVPESGKVTAILDPVTPIRIEVSEQDRRERNAAYREALKDEPLLRKKCDFRLDLRPSVLGNGSSAQAAGGAASAPPPGSELVMNGTLVSENCGMVISVNAAYVRLEEYYTKAVNYTLMITVISFAQVLLLIRQMEVTNTQASASKVSLLSIGIQAIMDSYLCLLHLTAGIVVEALFNAFATAAFFEFVIFAIFEMRYLLCIWRARRAGGDDGAGPHRELSILYTRFYGALLLVIFFAYQLQRWMRNIIFILYASGSRRSSTASAPTCGSRSGRDERHAAPAAAVPLRLPEEHAARRGRPHPLRLPRAVGRPPGGRPPAPGPLWAPLLHPEAVPPREVRLLPPGHPLQDLRGGGRWGHRDGGGLRGMRDLHDAGGGRPPGGPDGDAVQPLLPLHLPAAVDGRQDGVPHLPAGAPAPLTPPRGR
eukprot:CAMPEP_0177623596 /NCGR_PEP_ID=MMETSP0419_2-20121207/28988_1 /TAXON_ID=582737 /ORGANISM="Tetraselmis sp., Strain GSL018" /LENGTH=598 /DNA_ID=CAMNT_0019124161 /DNA_START=566 /DNA_END=2360 /DNA_ORIENTATION=+